jgi:hypothetical protein
MNISIKIKKKRVCNKGSGKSDKTRDWHPQVALRVLDTFVYRKEEE